MYSIWPSSSLSVVVLALAGVSDLASYIFKSQPIKKLMASRMTSTLEREAQAVNEAGQPYTSICMNEAVGDILSKAAREDIYLA